MIDLTKWDFISYKDIKVGDRLKVITEGTTNNLKTKTVTTATVEHQGWNAWYADNIRVTSDPEGKDEHFTVEIYRRKPKEIKERLGAVILAEGVEGLPGKKEHYVFDGLSWSSAHECASWEDLQDEYKKLTLIRKGVKLD